MKIAAIALAACCLIQGGIAAVRLKGMTHSRNLQESNGLPWTGPNYDIGVNGLNDSKTINTSGSGDILISLDISHLGTLEDSGASKDYLQIYYKIDEKPEVLWLDIVGENYSSPAKKTLASGTQLTIRTAGKSSYSNEVYQIRNFAITEVTNSPVPAPTAAVTPAPVTPKAPTSATCQLPWNGPNYEIDVNGLEKIEIIDTSCEDLEYVLVSLEISHSGTLEASGSSKDSLQVYYKVDDKPEELWLDITGEQYTSRSEKTIASGTRLTIRTVGTTSFNNEFYQISNFAVTEVANSPVPAPTAATCQLPWNGPNYEIDFNGLEKIEIIDTSCEDLDDVLISLDISQSGSLEASGSSKDYLQVYYKIDDKPEELWLDIIGEQYTSRSEKMIASGTRLTIRTVGSTSYNNEFYQISNFAVRAFDDLPHPTNSCKIPKFVGNWEDGNDYPLKVAEAQGEMIGCDFIIISGFKDGWTKVTDRNFALDLCDPNGEWRELAVMPISEGITHSGYVVIGQKLYMCGGYLGGNVGVDIDYCLVYDHSVKPKGKWSSFKNLPEGRSGGGMVYDSIKNQLIYAGGTDRPVKGSRTAYDKDDTWAYSFDNPGAGWQKKDDLPFLANHMSFVTAKDETGKERHFFLGGQEGEDEWTSNVDDNYEWDSSNEKWIKHTDMTITRGHAASSTRAIGCGFIIAGGSSNKERGHTDDISYYDIPTKTWTKIGELPDALNTPVCNIHDGYLYCETGHPYSKFSHKRKITVDY